MIFKTDKTKGGYEILSIHGPDKIDFYAGVIKKSSSYVTISWNEKGINMEPCLDSRYDLVYKEPCVLKSYWINIYGEHLGSSIYNSEEDCLKSASFGCTGYICIDKHDNNTFSIKSEKY